MCEQDPTKFEANPDVAEKVDELKALVEMVVKKVWREASVQVYDSKENDYYLMHHGDISDKIAGFA
jgi:hypothetical protein